MSRILYMTCVLSLLMASFASGLSLTVNNTLDLPDANPGDYVCQASNGQCTLRAAIDAADPAGCYDVDGSFLVTDQVGRPRPQGGRADIGAYETGPPVHIFADGFETGDARYWSEVVGG